MVCPIVENCRLWEPVHWEQTSLRSCAGCLNGTSPVRLLLGVRPWFDGAAFVSVFSPLSLPCCQCLIWCFPICYFCQFVPFCLFFFLTFASYLITKSIYLELKVWLCRTYPGLYKTCPLFFPKELSFDFGFSFMSCYIEANSYDSSDNDWHTFPAHSSYDISLGTRNAL